jgi:hypothetical protein
MPPSLRRRKNKIILFLLACTPSHVLPTKKHEKKEKTGNEVSSSVTFLAVMARHGTLSRRPAKEQLPADMRDDKTANTEHTHIPLPSLASSITCPDSDRCDIVGVSTSICVPPPLRRSVPVIRRFCPVIG